MAWIKERSDYLALLMAIMGFFVTAFIAEQVYERIPHIEDEFAFLWQAQVMADGDISRPSPEHEHSFLIPFVVDFEGRRFGKYPPGWPAALSLGGRLGAAGWVNPALSAMALWFMYRLARRVLNPGLSLLAELLLLSSPMFLLLSGTYMAHMLSLLLTLAFVLGWGDLFLSNDDPRKVPRWLLVLVTGGSIGLLFLTRPLTAVAIAFPFFVHGLFMLIKDGRRYRAEILYVGFLSLSIGSLLLLWQWALTGNALTNLYTLWWPYDRLGFGPGIGTTESGHSLYWAFYNTRLSLRAGLHDLFGWPYLSWVLIPFGLFSMYRRQMIWLLTAMFISIVAAYGFYWIGAWLFGPRYYFASLPGLAILSAGGIGWLGGWWAGAGADVRVRRLSSLAVLVMLLLVNAIFYLPLRVGGMKGLYQIDRESSACFVVDDPARTLIIVKAPRWFQYARYLYQVEPFTDSPLLIAWSQGSVADRALMSSYGDRAIYYYDVQSEEIMRATRSED